MLLQCSQKIHFNDLHCELPMLCTDTIVIDGLQQLQAQSTPLTLSIVVAA
jgi:hypothetical protein